MEMVAEMVLTALAAALLSFLVAKLVSAAVGGREAVVEERRLVGSGGWRSGKSGRFAGVEESRSMVVDRFEGVEDQDDDRDVVGRSFGVTATVGEGVEGDGFVRSESVGDCVEEIGEVAAVCGDGRRFEEMSVEGDEAERRGEVDGLMQGSPEKAVEMICVLSVEGRDEMLVGESRVESEGLSDASGHCGEQVEGAEGNEKWEKEEVAGERLDETGDESVPDIVVCCDPVEGSRSLKLKDADEVEEETESGNGSVNVDETGDGFGAEIVVSDHAKEVAFYVQAEHIDEIEEDEKMELQAMDVENSDVGEEEKNEELKDALADRIEKYLRNIESGVKEEENKDLQLEGDEKEKDETEEVIDAKVGPRLGSSGEEEDDWEGIEMSELDNDFTAAAAFVRREDKDGKLSSIGSEVRMQLYGLQKIIMEGPCREPQPMALKMSARAKWNAWQRLGNMNPEEAMKQYIALVADIVPNWTEQNTGVDDRSDGLEAKKLRVSDQDQPQPPNESQSKTELIYDTEGGGTSGTSSIESKDNK